MKLAIYKDSIMKPTKYCLKKKEDRGENITEGGICGIITINSITPLILLMYAN
jgi:hypothetical protein